MTVPFPKLSRGVVAILRGLDPALAVETARRVYEAGVSAIEVPLNSPDPFRSIQTIAEALPDALVGAGTVLKPEQVDDLHAAGGRLLISPNVSPPVLERAARYRMVTMPGVFTPTEAFLALDAGASALKFFPASVLGAKDIAAIRAVLPANTAIGAVGGVSEKDLAEYKAVGVTLFGLGSSLFKPGMTPDAVGARAAAAAAAWDRVFSA